MFTNPETAKVIYSIPQVANLTVSGVNARMHMVIASTYGRSSFQISRRAQNDLDFLIRNVDREPVPIVGTLSFIVYDKRGNTVFEKDLVLKNAQRAHFVCPITPAESLSMEIEQEYYWLVRHVDADDAPRILYTNHDYVVHGVLTATEGFLYPVDEPFVIETFTPTMGQYITSAFPGTASGSNTGEHSVVNYLVDYTGTISVYATLDREVPFNLEDWVLVTSEDYTDYTGTSPIHFEGNFMYVQFRLSSITGVTKLNYRN